MYDEVESSSVAAASVVRLFGFAREPTTRWARAGCDDAVERENTRVVVVIVVAAQREAVAIGVGGNGVGK
jgi:hypothetical protein